MQQLPLINHLAIFLTTPKSGEKIFYIRESISCDKKDDHYHLSSPKNKQATNNVTVIFLISVTKLAGNGLI